MTIKSNIGYRITSRRAWELKYLKERLDHYTCEMLLKSFKFGPTSSSQKLKAVASVPSS